MRPSAVLAFVLAWPLAAVAGAFPRETEAGGCLVERLAGGDGVSYTQFFGASPDGHSIVLGQEFRQPDGSYKRGTAFLLDLETATRTPLPSLNNAASFSPNGKKLVAGIYTGSKLLRTEIVEYDLETRLMTFLAPDAQGDWLPSYSPDGAAVYFNSYRSGASDIYRVDLAGGEPKAQTADARYEANAAPSRDGRYLYFHRRIESADYDVMRLRLATGAEDNLFKTPREESYPAPSPRGDLLAFSSDRDGPAGKNDLYIGRTNGGTPRRLTRDPVSDAYPSWSPDGRYLYYNAQHKDGTHILRLEIRNGGCERG